MMPAVCSVCRLRSMYAWMIGGGSVRGTLLRCPRMDGPMSLVSSCSTVLTMRRGLSSSAPRLRISSTPRPMKNPWMLSSRVSTSTLGRLVLSALVSLMRHLTMRSQNFACRPASPCATRGGGTRSSSSSSEKHDVREEFSRIFSMRTLRALSSCGPSSSNGTLSSSRRMRSSPISSLSAPSLTACDSCSSWNVCISVLSTYLHGRVLAPAPAAVASSKKVSTLRARTVARPSACEAKRATLVALCCPPAAAMSSWHTSFIPSTLSASERLLTLMSALRQSSATSSSERAPPSERRSPPPRPSGVAPS
mmetsp:Transcript_68021/g.215172  ORF Transcript_68021/g.215172 Transcript_68021/m.215172 type:complete len:307 (+) Transcript_68021:941-1861(+)